MDNISPNEPVNKGRQVELDLAKYLSTLFMIFLPHYLAGKLLGEWNNFCRKYIIIIL